MNHSTPTLETPRLLLRPTQRDDFEEFAEFLADIETMRFLGGAPQPRSVAWRSFLTMAGAWAIQGFAGPNGGLDVGAARTAPTRSVRASPGTA